MRFCLKAALVNLRLWSYILHIYICRPTTYGSICRTWCCRSYCRLIIIFYHTEGVNYHTFAWRFYDFYFATITSTFAPTKSNIAAELYRNLNLALFEHSNFVWTCQTCLSYKLQHTDKSRQYSSHCARLLRLYPLRDIQSVKNELTGILSFCPFVSYVWPCCWNIYANTITLHN